MRYLMDSLQSYETGHGDALCPIPKEAEKSFMGEHLLVKPVVTEEFRLVTSQILKKIGDLSLGNNLQAATPAVASQCSQEPRTNSGTNPTPGPVAAASSSSQNLPPAHQSSSPSPYVSS